MNIHFVIIEISLKEWTRHKFFPTSGIEELFFWEISHGKVLLSSPSSHSTNFHFEYRRNFSYSWIIHEENISIRNEFNKTKVHDAPMIFHFFTQKIPNNHRSLPDPFIKKYDIIS